MSIAGKDEIRETKCAGRGIGMEKDKRLLKQNLLCENVKVNGSISKKYGGYIPIHWPIPQD